MIKKLSTADVVADVTAGNMYISNNGVTIEVVSVANGTGGQERRYKRSYPAGSAPIGKALFMEFFKFKTFTAVPVTGAKNSGAGKGNQS